MCRPESYPVCNQPELSGASYDAVLLAPEDEWIAKLDHEAFKKDVRALGKELSQQQGPEDVAHLKKIIRWSRLCSWVGALTMGYCVNPISIYLMSLGIMTRWAIIAHHVCHGGFDKCGKGEYNRYSFGVGSLYRRCVDWLDWMLVEAWNVEHNHLHHYCLGEEKDPDLVEMNFKSLRAKKDMPRWLKHAAIAFMMGTWKWFYYAPNTFKQLKIHQMRRAGKVPKLADGTPVDESTMNDPWTLDPSWLYNKDGAVFFRLSELIFYVFAPYFIRQFLIIPTICMLLFGPTSATNALISTVLAEILTNYHSFLVIVTNHAGDDMYRFDRHCNPNSATFYLRQVTSSVNFRTSNGPGKPVHGFMADLNDFHHGWLNYQIEHHVWPDLSMLSYQKAAPLLKQLCEKHGVPYVQENVFLRLKKTVDIMTGHTSMRRYPTRFEVERDLALANDDDTSIKEKAS